MNEQPQPPQQPEPPQPPTIGAPQPGQPGVPPQYPASQQVPGQVTGIIGLVLAFVGFALIGIILSIISVVQASKGNASKTLGIIGIVVNAIGIVLFGLWLVFIAFAAYFGIQQRAQESATDSVVAEVSKKAEAYYTVEGKYPLTVQDFSKHTESTLTASNVTVTSVMPRDSHSVMYRACGDTGAEVVTYSIVDEEPTYRYLGSGSALTCTQ